MSMRQFFSFPFLEEDFFNFQSQTGLSISEDEKQLYVEAHLPGIKPEDIEVTFEGGTIWIRGESREEDKNKKFYRKASSSFSYRALIPVKIDEKKAPEASYKDGVLKVTFEKLPEAPAKKISIKVK